MTDNVNHDEKIARMEELIPQILKANEVYYATGDEIMTNAQWDALYDELLQLEKTTGVILPNSPTQQVGHKIISNLEKVTHPSPMLSLAKIKDVNELVAWLKNKKGWLSWKEDGMTIVLTYENGKLVSAVTRGDGIIGEVITENAKFFKGVPQEIAFSGRMVIRGEAVISYTTFRNFESEYKNARNLVSGTVRNLNTRVTKSRGIEFIAFNVIEMEGYDENSYSARLEFIKQFGFNPVPGFIVTADNLVETVKWFEKNITNYDIPSDGLVLMFDDIQYGESLGVTAKYPRNGIAFKWQDETAETVLRAVRWQVSRFGRVNPVAEFDPVELEGTTVTNASVNNVSYLKNLHLRVGDTLKVYKANMIIPQIFSNETPGVYDDNLIPKVCPVCGQPTRIMMDFMSEVLVCDNPDCEAKLVGMFEYFVDRECMNIAGLAVATLKTFIRNGILHDLADIYHIDAHKDEIVNLEGFGEKSYNKLITAIEKSRKTSFARFIAALGIPDVGVNTAKLIADDMSEVGSKRSKVFLDYVNQPSRLTDISGIGPVVAKSISIWFAKNLWVYESVLAELELEDDEIQPKAVVNSGIAGLTFVITGEVEHFDNRNALKSFIEKWGGKVSGSVSKKTDYLINNDTASTSGKNKKAKELGIPIISEQDFMAMV